MESETVNPSVLIWARETAGLDVAVAAKRLGFNDARKRSAASRLAAMEAGDEQPSPSTLLKMASVYHRPLLSLYLEHPPQQGDRGSDFRTLPEEKRQEDAASVDALVRDVRARQGLVRSLLEEDDSPRLAFVGSATMSTPVTELASVMARSIGFDRDQFKRGKVDDGFRYLRACVEKAGVFVLLLGNLGSHHSAISAEVFRGFAVSDDLAPFVVINDQDARVAWSFTLLHELAHIWLGLSGISGGAMEQAVERYCNEVASEILLPAAELSSSGFPNDASVEEFVSEIARSSNVSRALVIYRLFRIGSVSERTWRVLTEKFQMEWRQARDREKAEQAEKRGSGTGGPDYYTVQRFHLGSALVALVRRSVREGALSPTRAGQVLGVKATSVHPLISDKAA